MSSSTETTQNRQVLQGLPSEREAAFIALRFLSQFHCDESVQRLAEDLGKRHLLPVEYDWKGNMKTVSFEELSKLYPHIDENFLTTALGYALPGEPNPVTTLLQVSHGNRAKKNKRRTQSCIRLLLERATERAMMGTDSWPTSFLYKNIKRLKTLVGHMKPVYCIAFDSFSNYLVTGADDQLIKVWSVETGYLLHTLKFHEGEITDLAIHPWRPVLVSASNDSSLCVWDLPSGLLLCVLKGHSRGSSAVTFCRNPERPFLASGGSDGCVLLWNIDHPEYGPVRESLINIQSGTRRNGDEDELDDDFVPFDEQRDHVEDNTSDDNRMEVQDSSNAEPISPEQNSSDGEGTDQYLQILSLDFNNAGTLLAVGAANNRAYLYNLTMNEANLFQMEHLATLKGHTGAVYHVRFSHRGERLASGGTDGRAKIWRRKNIQGTQWSSLVLSMRQEHTGRSSREMVRNRRVNEPPRVTSLVWSLDDKFVITASSDCKIRVWNSTTGDLLHCLSEHQDHIYVLDTHPFDRRVILSADHNSLIILWDIEQGKVLKEFNLASPEMSSYASFPFHHRSLDGCFSPNGLLFAISDESGALILFGHGNGENLALAPQQQFFVHDLQSEQLHTFEERERRAKLPTRSLLCDMRGVKYPLSMQPLHIFRQHTYESRNLVEQERAHSDLVARAEASRRLELEEQERIAREERARARAAAIARLRREMNDSESENDEADSAENIRQRLRKRVSRKHSVIEYSFSESSESSSDPEMTYSTSDYSTSDDTLEGSNCDESEHSDVEDDVWMDSESSVSDASSPNREGIHYLRSSMKRTKNRGSKSNASRHRNGRDISKATSSTQSKISIRRKLKRSDWLRALSNDWSVYEYVPQIDDEVYYFPKGHLDFIRAEGIGQNHYVELVEYFHDEERPKKLKICSVDYIIVQRRKPCIVARLQVVPLGGTSSGELSIQDVSLELDYMFSEQVPDFIVLASRVEASLSRHWRVGEHFRTVYIGRDGQKSFYYGTVRSVSRGMYREPWNSIHVQWDADATEETLSPWELMEPYDVSTESDLNEFWISLWKTWTEAFGEDEQLVEMCSPFFVSLEELAMFPGYTDLVALPLNLEIVYRRLKNGFYRSLNSLDNDLKLVRDNCILYNEDGSPIQEQARQMYERLYSMFIDSVGRTTLSNGTRESCGSCSHHTTPASRRTKSVKRIETSSEEE